MKTFTLQAFNERFPTEDSCLTFLFTKKYPSGVHCTTCDYITTYHRVSGRKCYECGKCGTQVHPTSGTIFHKSSTSLRSWFYAIYLMASTRTGISAKQLERELGVTYKTAWRMFSQIRKLMAQDDVMLFGEVEADETYVGGKRPGKRGRGAAGKTIVAGVIERKGKVVAKVVPDVKAETLLPFVAKHTEPGSTVYTDELRSYSRLSRMGYSHHTVQHQAKQYVSGKAHTNNIESVWSNVKRGIDGVNHHVSPKHLQSYLDSYVFRLNHRHSDSSMFDVLMGRVYPTR